MQKRSDKLSKLATIKGILNGSLSIKDLRPQQIYFVNIRGEVYEVDGKEMNKDEYEIWKAANFRMSIDILFIMNFGEDETNSIEQRTYNKIEYDTWKAINTFDTNDEKEPVKEYKPQIAEEPKEPLFDFPVLEPIKQAIKEVKKPEVKKIKTKEIVEPEAPKRTFGKLSEYGIIWECQRN